MSTKVLRSSITLERERERERESNGTRNVAMKVALFGIRNLQINNMELVM